MGFSGFPIQTRFTPVPDPLLGPLLADIDSMDELKCTLRVLWFQGQRRGYLRYATLSQLVGDGVLARGLSKLGQPEQVVRQGLEKAVRRGTLLAVSVKRDNAEEQLLFVNTEANRKVVEKIKTGDLSIGELVPAPPSAEALSEKPNIFGLYEENIGMLTPLVAEELKEAEASYPWPWIEDAFKEAATHNKRSWRYISRILERWALEGKDSGEPGRHTEAADPRAYARKWQRFLKS